MGRRKMSENRTTLGVHCLTNAPETGRFVLADGRLLANLKDLANALEHMDDAVFSHHTTQGRNDFSAWVASVLGEEDLASDLSGKQSQADAQLAVLKHIASRVQ